MNESSQGDEIPLPDLHKATLDEPTLRELLADIQAHTELIGCVVKGASQARADNDWVGLHEAEELLLSGAARGVQIRYRHEGAQWWDTLMRHPQGFQLVRIRHDFREVGGAG